MAQKFVFSPSNMSTYKNCPLRFYGQSISKQIKWKASAQKSRGSLIHSDIQKAVAKGMQAVTSWQDGIDPAYTTTQIQDVRTAMSKGGVVFIEKELCVDNKFNAVDWWHDNAMLRARADLLLKHDGKVLLVDLKTGKIWDTDDFQLRVEALLAHLIYKVDVVDYEYWYVDQGETVDGSIDFRNGLAPVQDIIDLMVKMRTDMKNNSFFPTANKFCNWCDWNNTPNCVK